LEEITKTAEVARGAGIRIVIENEDSTNVGTGHALARPLGSVPAANVGANWDVGNDFIGGEVSRPNGHQILDKKRLWHLHQRLMGRGVSN
jgi:sugar phosphate isomerase/epimerase